jgi:hypothetical protein
MKRLMFHLGGLALLAGTLRAQVTEVPQTIEPGKFLLRMDAVTVGINRDKLEPAKYTALGLASSILSIGMTRDVDVQIGRSSFSAETYQYRGGSSTRSGWGDTAFRTKWTFWRNDAAGEALAVIPYVKIPSNVSGIGNNHVEGGFIVPWSKVLGAGSSAGAMAQWDILRNDLNNGYDSRWFVSAFVRQHVFGGTRRLCRGDGGSLLRQLIQLCGCAGRRPDLRFFQGLPARLRPEPGPRRPGHRLGFGAAPALAVLTGAACCHR